MLDPVDRVLLPRADIATETLAAGLRERGWEIDDVTAYRTVRAAPPPAADPRGDQDRRVRRGVLHLVVHGAQPGRDRRQAARPHDRRLHRPADRRDRPRVRPAGRRAARRRPRVPALVDALAAHAAQLRAEGALPPPRKAKARRR